MSRTQRRSMQLASGTDPRRNGPNRGDRRFPGWSLEGGLPPSERSVPLGVASVPENASTELNPRRPCPAPCAESHSVDVICRARIARMRENASTERYLPHCGRKSRSKTLVCFTNLGANPRVVPTAGTRLSAKLRIPPNSRRDPIWCKRRPRDARECGSSTVSGAPDVAVFTFPQFRGSYLFSIPEETVDKPQSGASGSSIMHGLVANAINPLED